MGVPEQGLYEEIFNSDSKCYGGSGQVNNGLIEAETIPYHGQAYSIHIKVPPLGGVLIKLSKKYVVMEAEHVKEQGKLYKGLQDEVCRNSGKSLEEGSSWENIRPWFPSLTAILLQNG